jgi:hypothetical protein
MWCERRVDPDGGVTIICHGGRRPAPKRCVVCQRTEAQTALVLCDAVVRPDAKRSRTCDAAVCTAHAVHREPDTDYCPAHAREGREAGEEEA